MASPVSKASASRLATRSLRTAACAVGLAALGIAQEGAGAAAAETPVDLAHTFVEKRLEAWSIITKEKADWRTARQILEDRIAMAKRETEEFRKRTAEAEKNITETDVKNDELVGRKEKLEDAAKSLTEPAAALEKRLMAVLPRLPAPLRDHVKLMTQRIPENPDEADQRLAIRFGNVAAVLQEIDKWNRTINVVPELLELEDGRKAEVTVMYLGLGQGYYVSADDKHAGVGTATATAWVWQPADQAAPAVREAIEIYKKKKTARFVSLPVRVVE